VPARDACRSCGCRMWPSRHTGDRSTRVCRICYWPRVPWAWAPP
jgi:hypothetical protein